MSAVACRERDQMMRSLGKCSVSRHSLLIRLCCCRHSSSISATVSAAIKPDGQLCPVVEHAQYLCSNIICNNTQTYMVIK